MSIDLAFLENAGNVLHAHDFRRLLRGLYLGEGVVDGLDLDVTQRGAGANMSVDVAPGQCLIYDDASLLGLYPFISDAVTNLTIGPSGANPRIDLIVARVRDTEYGDGSDSKTLEVIAGTPAASPTVPAVPTRCFALAQVLVAAGASSITNAAITERRVWSPGSKLARGMIDRATLSATSCPSDGSAVTITGSNSTGTLKPFRMLRYGITVRVKSSVAGDVATVTLEKDSASTGVQADVTCAVANRAYTVTIWTTDSPTAGSHTYRARLARGIGTGIVTAEGNGRMVLEDVGEGTIV